MDHGSELPASLNIVSVVGPDMHCIADKWIIRLIILSRGGNTLVRVFKVTLSNDWPFFFTPVVLYLPELAKKTRVYRITERLKIKSALGKTSVEVFH